MAASSLLTSCGEDTERYPRPNDVVIGGADGRVLDSEYVARRFFSLQDVREPLEPVESGEIAIFRTTRSPEADRRNGRETFDARGSGRGDDAGRLITDLVVRLVPNDDYYVITVERVRGILVVLRNALPYHERLYASYIVRDPEVPRGVGNYWDTRSPGDSLSLKVMALTAADVSGGGLPNDFINATLRLERRNVYDLEQRDIDPGTLNLTIRRIGGADPTRIDGVPLLTATGLDLLNNGTLIPCRGPFVINLPMGPDGLVDRTWIDEAAGFLYFPDQQPFDPDTFDLVDPATGNVRDACRTRVIGWELEDPTPNNPGDESYVRIAEAAQAIERNGALYTGFRAGPADAHYEIMGTYEAIPE